VVFPVTPGWDIAGTIERVGYLAEGFSKGDEVLGYAWMDFLHHGSYAEYMAVPLRTIVHKPPTISWEEAAALPLAGLTAYQAIKKVEIHAGDTVLAHGAAGGTGSLGIQILQILGAKVIGTASPANHEFVADLGATPVAYGDGLDDAVHGLAPDGVDGVVDF
jgi:NADPH:quinone reductase-like Zn-dependent oxidoreductase